jgi:tetratricopeptide (TPR) repeat protein
MQLAEIKTVSTEKWTNGQAYGIAIVCLAIGLGGGWFIKTTIDHAAPTSVATVPKPDVDGKATPNAQQLQQAAETQVVPLLEQLKIDPNNASLLENLGNVYYDARQYPKAIEFYQRCLNLQPANSSVRTDMATAIWYTGNADGAIAEFQKSLSHEPTKPNTLFNLGIVLSQGKHDAAGAVAVWQKLLATNPNYENKEKVQQLIANAKQ